MEELNLIELTEKITQKIIREVTEAYHANQINEILKKYGLDEEIQYSYYDINRAKILVIGNSRVNKNDLYGIAKSLGIRRDILEFELDYIRIHNFDFNNLRNSMVYSDVLVGPMPHRAEGIDGYSSFLAMADSHPEEFPKIIKLQSSNELKITKESFRNGLQNTRYAQLSNPKLTCVEIPIYEVGSKAMSYLTELMKEEEPSKNIKNVVVDYSVIWRETTK